MMIKSFFKVMSTLFESKLFPYVAIVFTVLLVIASYQLGLANGKQSLSASNLSNSVRIDSEGKRYVILEYTTFMNYITRRKPTMLELHVIDDSSAEKREK